MRQLTALAAMLLSAAGVFGQESIRERAAATWPTRRAAKAVAAGTLRLKVLDASRSIDTFERVELKLTLENTGTEPVETPSNWRLGVEIVPDADPTQRWTWWPKTNRRLRASRTLAPGRTSGRLGTCHWMAKYPLQGRPEEWPYLVPGTYRYRLKLLGAPRLQSDWQPLEVRKPTLSAAAKGAAARRPNGRLILVDPDRPCPVPNGTAARPFRYLRNAIRQAKCGDVVFCEPGRHYCENMVVPDDVWLIGAGAARTTLGAGSKKPMGAALELLGASRLEGFCVVQHAADNKYGYFIRAQGAQAKPTIYQCAIIPPDRMFAGVTAWQEAAPTIRNCLIVSPTGNYGVFARNRARPTIEYCTIISRGFGVGMMDGAAPTIKRCIIAGRCPGILRDSSCKFDLRDTVIWCPRASRTFPHAVTQSVTERIELKEGKVEYRTYYVAVPGAMKRPDIHSFDPQFKLGKHSKLGWAKLHEYLVVPDSSDAAAYGAFAGKAGKWLREPETRFHVKLPDLSPYLKER